MKNIFVVGLILSSVMLVSCSTKKNNSSVTQTKSSNVADNSRQSKSSEVSKPSETIASSNESVKIPDVQGSDLTQARLALYQAGVDSSSISDEQLVKYWQAAKQEKSDCCAEGWKGNAQTDHWAIQRCRYAVCRRRQGR